jgi:hypothetical protein
LDAKLQALWRISGRRSRGVTGTREGNTFNTYWNVFLLPFAEYLGLLILPNCNTL